jgi:subtilisin family serine protease
MKPLLPLPTSAAAVALAALAFAACAAPARTGPVAPAPAPVASSTAAPAPDSATAPDVAAAPVIAEAPKNWQLLDEAADRVPGISAERAMRELLAGRQPQRTVVVAVIDGGVDTAHADIAANLWKNPRETAANGKDDDGNGYADDVRGWNFIGGRDGRDVGPDTYEVTRLYVRCGAAAAGAQGRVSGKGGPRDSIPAAERQRCPEVAAEFEKQRSEAERTLQQVRMIDMALSRIVPVLRTAAATDSLTLASVQAIQPKSAEVSQARGIYLQLAANGITPEDVADAKKSYESRLEYGLNPSFDPRPIVGDKYADPTDRRYGNTDVMGPDAEHGTHVAGIIGALRGNGVGVDGIAPAVRIMSVRTVPDGDERDKDVANAIRYAVDNGAQVLNMSFGKSYSPYKGAVDEAVKYADAHGVLMVHAAGNDGQNLDENPNFPTAAYLGGGRARNWIEVGASSWRGPDSLAAPFTNYSKTQVDVFAPGVDILSTVPGGGYKRESGTSMATPVVSGLAALIMAYYPNLTAADVKRIILQSAVRHAEQMVVRPGAAPTDKVPFGSLSATGGIVNAYAALKMAAAESAVRP